MVQALLCGPGTIYDNIKVLRTIIAVINGPPGPLCPDINGPGKTDLTIINLLFYIANRHAVSNYC